jgi:hypothetical protein
MNGFGNIFYLIRSCMDDGWMNNILTNGPGYEIESGIRARGRTKRFNYRHGKRRK